MIRTRFTKQGYENLKAELDSLNAERPGVILDVQKARELGDLKENGYYQASKGKLRSIDSRLERVNYLLKTGIIIEETSTKGVGIGSTVTLQTGDKEMTYQFVGDLEADPSQKKLSLLSPIGKAVEGHEQGDTVEVNLPMGLTKFKIVKIV
jgi:transcription elongation factor GreA